MRSKSSSTVRTSRRYAWHGTWCARRGNRTGTCWSRCPADRRDDRAARVRTRRPAAGRAARADAQTNVTTIGMRICIPARHKRESVCGENEWCRAAGGGRWSSDGGACWCRLLFWRSRHEREQQEQWRGKQTHARTTKKTLVKRFFFDCVAWHSSYNNGSRSINMYMCGVSTGHWMRRTVACGHRIQCVCNVKVQPIDIVLLWHPNGWLFRSFDVSIHS